MFDFPNSPTQGQQFTPQGGPTYVWNGTGWTLVGVTTAGLLGQQVFTNPGTPTTTFNTIYTPTPGMVTAIVECVGGGAGGAGIYFTTATIGNGPGGGAGGYSRKFIRASDVVAAGGTLNIIIGAGGVGGAAPASQGLTSGGAGGDTSAGALCLARGAPASATGAANAAYAGSPGGPATGTGDIVVAGSPSDGGTNGPATGTAGGFGGGANSYFGGGGRANSWATGSTASLPGNAATGYGSGGGGAATNTATAGAAGGNGFPGIVIVTEYAAVPLSSTVTGAQPGALSGLVMTWTNATTLQLAAGAACSDDFTTTMITQGIASKLVGTNFAPGSGNGAYDNQVAFAASSWYHVYLIQNPVTGVADLLTTKATNASPLLPSGFTKQRRIGSIKTDASSNMVQFLQNGDQFLFTPVPSAYDAPFPIVTSGAGLPGTLFTANTPLGVRTIALFYYTNQVSASQQVSVTDPETTASGTAYFYNAPTPSTTGTVYGYGQIAVQTNTSAQVRVASSANQSGFGLATYGWIDGRGK